MDHHHRNLSMVAIRKHTRTPSNRKPRCTRLRVANLSMVTLNNRNTLLRLLSMTNPIIRCTELRSSSPPPCINLVINKISPQMRNWPHRINMELRTSSHLCTNLVINKISLRMRNLSHQINMELLSNSSYLRTNIVISQLPVLMRKWVRRLRHSRVGRSFSTSLLQSI